MRPQRQKCVLLGGTGNLARNYPALYIALKIRLGPKFADIPLPTARDTFPDEHENLGLKRLIAGQSNPTNDHLFPV